MERLFTFARRLEGISTAFGRLSAWAIVGLMLVIVADVTLRHWFVIGSTKLQELEWHLHGALFLLCLGWALSRNTHVRIELISERLSPRARAWIELWGCLLFLIPYVLAVLWFGYDYVAYSFAYSEASASPTGLPYRWIIKGCIVLGFALLGLAAIVRVLDAIIYLFGPAGVAGKTGFARSHVHPGES